VRDCCCCSGGGGDRTAHVGFVVDNINDLCDGSCGPFYYGAIKIGRFEKKGRDEDVFLYDFWFDTTGGESSLYFFSLDGGFRFVHRSKWVPKLHMNLLSFPFLPSSAVIFLTEAELMPVLLKLLLSHQLI